MRTQSTGNRVDMKSLTLGGRCDSAAMEDTATLATVSRQQSGHEELNARRPMRQCRNGGHGNSGNTQHTTEWT
eukprot:14538365-Alexandrium_andersonii.AAC.1